MKKIFYICASLCIVFCLHSCDPQDGEHTDEQEKKLREYLESLDSTMVSEPKEIN